MPLFGNLLAYSVIAMFTVATSQCSILGPPRKKIIVSSYHATKNHNKKSTKATPVPHYEPMQVHMEAFELSQYQVTSPIPDTPRPADPVPTPTPTPTPAKKQAF